MKIKVITSQNRRDFMAIMICEGCNHEQELRSGYDDRYYHDNVAPEIKCESCKKTRKDLGVEGEYTATKYPEGFQT